VRDRDPGERAHDASAVLASARISLAGASLVGDARLLEAVLFVHRDKGVQSAVQVPHPVEE